MKKEQTRYFFIDGIRGAAIINMVVFHFLYDVFVIYGQNPVWYRQRGIHVWQQAICQTFIFISGLVWQWGMEGNLRRGLRFLLYSVLISLVTLLSVPSEAIWFGILYFMGSAVLLMFPLQKVLRRVPRILGSSICLSLFILCKRIQYGWVGIGNLMQMPNILYTVKVLTPFGFPFPGFRSSDYFPILPWIFLYLCGYFFNGICMKYDRVRKLASYKVPVLSALGSRTIWIYLVHQPISMLICEMIFG